MGTSSIYTAHVQRTPRRPNRSPDTGPDLELPRSAQTHFQAHASSERHALCSALCALRMSEGSGDEEAKGLGADSWTEPLALGSLATANFYRERFFPWQHHGNPLPLCSIQLHQNLQLLHSYLRPLLQSAEIPRETNCLVSHSCWKQHEGLESGRPPSGCHKQALSLHPRDGLRLPLRGNTERFICGKHCVKSLWKVPQQIPLPRGGA